MSRRLYKSPAAAMKAAIAAAHVLHRRVRRAIPGEGSLNYIQSIAGGRIIWANE